MNVKTEAIGRTLVQLSVVKSLVLVAGVVAVAPRAADAALLVSEILDARLAMTGRGFVRVTPV